MAAGGSYPVDLLNPEGTEVRSSGLVTFTDSTNQPAPGGTNQATVPAATAVTSAPRISQLTSALTITSGTLPNTGAWVSGTAKQNPTTVTTPARQVTINVVVAGDATNNIATCLIAVSPDNSTYTTVATVSIAAALNNLGALAVLNPVNLPAAWYIKLTIGANATVAASIWY